MGRMGCIPTFPVNIKFAVADLVGARDAPRGPNSFNFMQLLGKFGKIVCCPPSRPGELASGKSWIRHWFVTMTVTESLGVNEPACSHEPSTSPLF